MDVKRDSEDAYELSPLQAEVRAEVIRAEVAGPIRVE
jgi:hypothetical protein